MTATEGGISIHAVDITKGTPAEGLTLRILRDDAVISTGQIGPRGTLTDTSGFMRQLAAGAYRAEFDVAAYFRAQGVKLPRPAFQDISTFDFNITDPKVHIHLPFKFSPWGFSLFRGTP